LNRRSLWSLALAVIAAAPLALAQGGAGSTGSIQGEVLDESGAMLPGVTVTATGTTLLGVQTATTNSQGAYRFPGLPAGTYKLTFELGGFSKVSRDDVRIGIGFTASVNAKLSVKTMQEEVTVTGDTTIDTTATRVQTNFGQEQLDSLPNARDMWSLLAETPAVSLNRFDVGASTMGTQTTYFAYGYNGQNRPLIEGINTTEGTNAAGFYFDYGSFDEVFVGAAGNSAEMPNPGVLTQFVGKSGGNRFGGTVYFDMETEAIQGRNLTEDQIASGIRRDGNRLDAYKNLNLSLGGPVLKDKLWWYAGYLRQQADVAEPRITDGTIFSTKLINYTGKLTYQITPKDKLIGYLQYGIKQQPNRILASGGSGVASGSAVVANSADTTAQDSPSWVGKLEYNRTLGSRGLFEIRAGQFGYNFGLLGNSTGTRYEDLVTNAISGGGYDWVLRRRRDQLTGSMSYFLDNRLGGNHAFKVGGEILRESGETGYQQGFTNHVVHYLRSGVPSSVRLYSTPLVAENGLRTTSAFVNDAWSIRRLTLNLGLRYDRYRVFLPEQNKPAGPFSEAASFAAVPEVKGFNNLAPRLGATYDLAGDGKTVVKAAFGRYYFNPGVNLADAVNPNASDAYADYTWNDLNGDRSWQRGEEVTLTFRQGGAGNVAIDPNLKNSYTHEASAFVERELLKDVGVRAGFVWKKDYDGYQTMNVDRPASAFSQPTSVADPGPDGRAGTSDDGVISAFNLDDLARGTRNVTMNVPGFQGTYKTVEAALSRRFRGKWSLVASFAHTWTDEFARGYFNQIFGTLGSGASLQAGSTGAFPNSPNDRNHNEFTSWNAKVHGSYEPGWGVRLTPVLRYQAGQAFGRILSARLNYGTQAILVEPIGTRRQDDVVIIDLRAEKKLQLAGKARLGLFVDVFNATNSNVATNIRWTTGLLANGQPAFGTALNVLPPRIAKFGVKLDW